MKWVDGMRTFDAREIDTIRCALRVAAEVYGQDVVTSTLPERLKEQFAKQKREAEALLEELGE